MEAENSVGRSRNNTVKDRICSALLLPASIKREIIAILRSRGYTTKDIAEIMGVSLPAASRYIHGSLIPGNESICRAISKLVEEDADTLVEVVNTLTRELWTVIEAITTASDYSNIKELETIADRVALLLYQAKTRGEDAAQY